MVAVVWHGSACGQLPPAETAITQGDIEEQARDRGDEIKSKHARHASEVGERNEGKLGAKRERDVKPGPGDPGFGRMQRPEGARHRHDDRAADHQEQLPVEVRIFVSQNEKKLAREKVGGSNNGETESGDRADDPGVLPAKFRGVLATRERGREHIREEMTQNGEDHGEPAKSADLRDRANLPPKKTDEKNGDLTLQAKEDRVRRLAPNEAEHGGAVLGVFGRAEINYAADVAMEHPILKEQRGGTDREGDRAVQKKIYQHDQGEETRDRSGEVDALDSADVGSQSGHDTEDPDRELDGEACQDGDNEKGGVVRRRTVLHQQVIKNRNEYDDGRSSELP